MQTLMSDADVIAQVFKHIDNDTTDLGDETWQEPTEHYTCSQRFADELTLISRLPTVFAPSAALADAGAYIARAVAGVQIVVVRDRDMKLHAFRNACRHRGAALAQGEGQVNLFRCPYHGWAYGLNGELQHVPHQEGFPNLDLATCGLVPLHDVVEKGGLVFVSIEPPLSEETLSQVPTLIPPDYELFDRAEDEYDFNWKLNIEATLEGYHIKSTHPESFYPYGYDNLNVVETFGPHGRVTFPFRRIEQLREVPPQERKIGGTLTYAYNIFPNCTIAVLSNHISLLISEPLSPVKTRTYAYKLGQLGHAKNAKDIEKMRRDAKFVSDTGFKEDVDVVYRIQTGLLSGANEHFTYGHFERAIVHFHKNLSQLIERL